MSPLGRRRTELSRGWLAKTASVTTGEEKKHLGLRRVSSRAMCPEVIADRGRPTLKHALDVDLVSRECQGKETSRQRPLHTYHKVLALAGLARRLDGSKQTPTLEKMVPTTVRVWEASPVATAVIPLFLVHLA